MKSVLLVAVGGIAGSLSRFGLSFLFEEDRSGTLAANLIGVSIAALLLVLMERRGITELRLLLLPGYCGGLTTFSGVTVLTLEPNQGGPAYLAMTALLSLALVVIILPLSRKLIPVR